MSDGDAGGGVAPAAPAESSAPGDSGGGGSPDAGAGPDNSQPVTSSDDNGANNNNNDIGAAAVTSAAANNDFGEMAAPYSVAPGNHSHDQDHDAALDRPPDLAYNQGRIEASSPFQPRVHEYRPTVRQRTVELDEYFVSSSIAYVHLILICSYTNYYDTHVDRPSRYPKALKMANVPPDARQHFAKDASTYFGGWHLGDVCYLRFVLYEEKLSVLP